MKRVLHIACLLTFVALFAACGDNIPVIELPEDNSAAVKEHMINANRVVIRSEETQIECYLQRRNWSTTPLPCGARYMTYTPGTGAAVNPDDTVAVQYRLEALDGSAFYTDQTDTLVVGRHQVTVALDDLLQQMRYGGQAWLIAPSNSAYGVVGDGDRVPSRTVIVYNVTKVAPIHSQPKKTTNNK